MNILITGGSGFLGKHLVAHLIKDGYKIIALHRRSNSSELLDDPCVLWVDFDYLKSKFQNLKIDIVLHLATNYGKNEKTSAVIDSNVLLPIKILELAILNKCKLFINTDTYFTKKLFQYKHMHSYIDSKIDFLKWSSLLIQNQIDFRYINFRIEHLYGPNDNEDKFVPIVLKKLVNGENIKLTKGGQLRDFIFVTDVVEAYRVLTKSITKIPFGISEVEVGTGVSTSIYDFVTLAKKLIDSNSTLNFGALEYRNGEIMHSVANNSSLISYGWKPKYTLTEGLELILIEEFRINRKFHL